MNKQIFFASDFHLGIPDAASSRARELHIVRWLHFIGPQASKIFLLGDVFDFWMDYRYVVPRGYVRLLGTLAELADTGIEIHFFTGNHDQWLRDYFTQEMGWRVYYKPLRTQLGTKEFFLAHGDGLGPGDHGYKFVKWLFTRKVNRWLFRQIHPDLGYRIARFFSHSSRHYAFFGDPGERNPEKDRAYNYCLDYQRRQKRPVDFFVCGHSHQPVRLPAESGEYINLGDWLRHYSYARFDGEQVHLEFYTRAL